MWLFLTPQTFRDLDQPALIFVILFLKISRTPIAYRSLIQMNIGASTRCTITVDRFSQSIALSILPVSVLIGEPWRVDGMYRLLCAWVRQPLTLLY